MAIVRRLVLARTDLRGPAVANAGGVRVCGGQESRPLTTLISDAECTLQQLADGHGPRRDLVLSSPPVLKRIEHAAFQSHLHSSARFGIGMHLQILMLALRVHEVWLPRRSLYLLPNDFFD
jgi:hypothetical protein